MMLHLFDQLSIRAKLYWMIIMALLGMIIVTLVGFNLYRESLILEKTRQVKASVQIATNLMSYYDAQIRGGGVQNQWHKCGTNRFWNKPNMTRTVIFGLLIPMAK